MRELEVTLRKLQETEHQLSSEWTASIQEMEAKIRFMREQMTTTID